ncbi:TIGR03435 family protein [Granulicella sp. 5B5]|uniref:TIGR03435 family protein n=1 Tax=Granulicella sp. 5B5 TaxID=1617967 RepID=UPI0015F747D1|nr:TIGR03435 family protein [Granulicella sp. 5B5]QMV17420.1 TIGR03435 family protein [Granulicella sp. 5B5]
MTRRLPLFLIALALASTAYAQTRLTFEVASIRASKADTLNGGIKPLPGGYGYIAQNMPVKIMISLMYRIPMRQIKGAPDWLNTERFDIEAKADHAYSVEDLHAMFQSLLADRFNLKFHIETKQGNVYALSVDPAGLKMKPNDSPQDYNIPVNFAANGFVGRRVPMPYLCWFLGQQLQDDARPVVDETGLKGNYDFNLSFRPVRPPDVSREDSGAPPDDRPSIYDALKEQLGLRLQPQKGPVDYLVIDSIQKPSVN